MVVDGIDWLALVREYVIWDVTSLNFVLSLLYFVIAVITWRIKFGKFPRKALIEIYIQCFSMGVGTTLGLSTYMASGRYR